MTETIEYERQTVVETNLIRFINQIAEMLGNNWELDEKHEPSFLGFVYEAHFIRDPEDAPPVKLTRQQVCAKAREAKRLRKEAADKEKPNDEQS